MFYFIKRNQMWWQMSGQQILFMFLDVCWQWRTDGHAGQRVFNRIPWFLSLTEPSVQSETWESERHNTNFKKEKKNKNRRRPRSRSANVFHCHSSVQSPRRWHSSGGVCADALWGFHPRWEIHLWNSLTQSVRQAGNGRKPYVEDRGDETWLLLRLADLFLQEAGD